jgi:ribose 5-phosphate isomerase A
MDELKRAAALAAVDMVQNDTVVGLGSGTTLAYAIRELGERVRSGRLKILGVPTSYQARLLAVENGIPIRESMDVDAIDITIDGADEVDPQGNLIKGGGAAHCTEKVVAAASRRLVIIVDESKIVKRLGTKFAVPVDVFPAGLALVMRRLRELGGTPAARFGQGKIGPVISDLGNIVVDVRFDGIGDPAMLDREINAIPGVVGHGLFIGMCSQAIVARPPLDKPVIQVLDFARGS